MEKINSIRKKYPLLDIGIYIIVAIIPYTLTESNMISNAMIQLNWCSEGDSICLLKHYGKLLLFIVIIFVFTQILVSSIKKIKSLPQKIMHTNFSPKIILKENKYYLLLSYPDIFKTSLNVSYSITYEKTDSKIDELIKSKTKLELIESIIKNAMYPNSVKPSFWFKFPLVKVRKNKSSLIPLFEINRQNNIFYLYRDSGKPNQFWNNEPNPKLEELSFGFGDYIFQVDLSTEKWFHKKYIQNFVFSINY